MTILLEPAVEARLWERAAREKQDADAMANALLREDAEKEKAFDEALLASGFITHIPPPREPSKGNRPRIEVQGEPVSETFIEERHHWLHS